LVSLFKVLAPLALVFEESFDINWGEQGGARELYFVGCMMRLDEYRMGMGVGKKVTALLPGYTFICPLICATGDY
jgi:hypothetical protein